MTTIVFSRMHGPRGQIAADSRNTDSAGAVFQVDKIERLKNGWYFLGSGHLYTIGQARKWAEAKFSARAKPDFEVLFGECSEEFRFSALVISPDGQTTILIDDEMCPQPVTDKFLAVGSGAAYALGALKAGASPLRALEIACECDGSTGGPIKVHDL